MEAFNYYILNELKKKHILKIIEKHSIVTITDRLGRIEYVSDCYCDILECEPNQLIGESHKLIGSHLHTRILYKNLWKTIRSGHKWNGILNDESANGNSFWLETTILPLKSKKTVKYLAIYNDVTKFQLEKQKLLKQSKANKSLLEIMPFQIFEISSFGKILNTNKNYKTYKFNELIDNYLFDFINPKWHENFKDVIEAVFKLKVPHQFETILIGVDGNELLCSVLISPVFDETGKIKSALITIQEISDHIKGSKNNADIKNLNN